MSIAEWWPNLDAESRSWLSMSEGRLVPSEVLHHILAAGGSLTPDNEWMGSQSPDGFRLSDEAVRWIKSERATTHRDNG